MSSEPCLGCTHESRCLLVGRVQSPGWKASIYPADEPRFVPAAQRVQALGEGQATSSCVGYVLYLAWLTGRGYSGCSSPPWPRLWLHPRALQILSPQTHRSLGRMGQGTHPVPVTCLSSITEGLRTPVSAWATSILQRIEPKLQLWPGRGVKVQVEIQLLMQRPYISPRSCQAGC